MKNPCFSRVVISLSTLIILPGFLMAQNPDASTAAVYFDKAEALYHAGDDSSASEMIAAALQFNPDSSEALYLGALLSLKSQQKTLEGIALAEKAVAKATWTKTDPDSAALVLAETLVRIGRLDEAIPLLQRLASVKSEDPRSALFLARAYMKSGKLELAENTAAAARRRFPKSEELYLLSSELAVKRGNKAEARIIAATGLSEIPDGKKLMLKALELDPDPKSRIQRLDAYTAKGGSDPSAAVIALEAGQKDREKYYDLFMSLEGLSRADLWRRVSVAVAGSAVLSASFKADSAAFTGFRDLDLDSNGFYEERWIYRDGKPVTWVKDANEDGEAELRAGFASGRISTIENTRDGKSTLLRYEEYPFLDMASETDDSGTRRYLLTPRTLGCSMTDISALSMDFRFPTRSQILSAAYREEDLRGTTAIRSVDLSDGRSIYKEEDSDGDGKIDRKTWYSGGKPIAGKRDLDGDGSFGLAEVYLDGVLRERRVDDDGDGTAEYAELLGDAPAKVWDFNADGRWDSRETSATGGTLIREFSTAFNGVFDVRVEFRGGRIASVRKNGVDIPIARDEKSGVVWIGTTRIAGISASIKEGAIVLGGRRYLVFRYNSTTYIEELE